MAATSNEPATVLGLTLITTIQCQQCEQQETIVLVNAVHAACPTCGTVFSVDAVEWSNDQPQPKVALSLSPRSLLVTPH